eukprot:7421217-Alexandrium_andersonii.AAC.1
MPTNANGAVTCPPCAYTLGWRIGLPPSNEELHYCHYTTDHNKLLELLPGKQARVSIALWSLGPSPTQHPPPPSHPPKRSTRHHPNLYCPS